MRYIILIISFFFLSANHSRAQNGFSKLYDFCDDTALVLSEGAGNYADSNIIYSFGTSTIPGIYPIHSYITAFDYSANLKWHKKILLPNLNNSYSSPQNILKLNDNKYLAIATVEDRKVNSRLNVWYPLFYYFNANGDSLRCITYPDTIGVKINTALVQHGPYIVTGGHTTSDVITTINGSYAYKDRAAWICKYDTLGNIIWQKDFWYKSLGVPDIQSVVLSADGQHYVFAGRLPDTSINFYPSSCIVKTDTNGNIVWVNSLKKKYLSEHKLDIVTNPTGGYYFTSSWSTEPDIQGQTTYSQIYYGKLNELGDTLWTKVHFDTTNLPYGQGHKIAWAPDGDLVIQATGDGGLLPTLLKIDTLGNVRWIRTYLHAYNFNEPWRRPTHAINGFSITPDNRYFLSGYISANGPIPGVYDAPNGPSRISWFVLTDTGGCRYPGDPACWPLAIQNTNALKPEVKIYPNPMAGILKIELPRQEKGLTLLLADITGRNVLNQPLPDNINNIQVEHLPPGVYIAKTLQNGMVIKLTKLVKQ